jgi:hypothetical protein
LNFTSLQGYSLNFFYFSLTFLSFSHVLFCYFLFFLFPICFCPISNILKEGRADLFYFLMANNHFTLIESFYFYLTVLIFLLVLPSFVYSKILTGFYSIYFWKFLIKCQFNLMVGLKITSNNVKLVKLWFFIKFLNFSKTFEILTQAKPSYYKTPRKISEFFNTSIENYKISLHKTSQQILIKSWP